MVADFQLTAGLNISRFSDANHQGLAVPVGKSDWAVVLLDKCGGKTNRSVLDRRNSGRFKFLRTVGSRHSLFSAAARFRRFPHRFCDEKSLIESAALPDICLAPGIAREKVVGFSLTTITVHGAAQLDKSSWLCADGEPHVLVGSYTEPGYGSQNKRTSSAGRTTLKTTRVFRDTKHL